MEKRSRTIIVLKRIGIFVGTLILLFLLCKFALFFMPFLIAGIMALVLEPIIKFFMNKLKFSRRVSSFIVVILTIAILGGLLFWGVTELYSELSDLKDAIAPAISETIRKVNEFVAEIDVKYTQIPDETVSEFKGSAVDLITTLGNYIGNLVSYVVDVAFSLPAVLINIIITIMALVFLTKDRIYVIDLLEYHFPKAWISKSTKVISEIFSTVGGYIKVYLKIICITFAELFLAFNIYNWIGFNVPYPFALALVSAFVDILPILGVGTILNPWAIWMLITGNYGFAAALFITYAIIFVIRQFLEPKLVSKQFGIHPIITLMAMYAGFRFWGFTGLILGPIALMTLRCIFAKQIEKGLFKDLFNEN